MLDHAPDWLAISIEARVIWLEPRHIAHSYTWRVLLTLLAMLIQTFYYWWAG